MAKKQGTGHGRLLLEAKVDLQAASGREGSVPQFHVEAYNGGTIRPAWFGHDDRPTIIDLAGLKTVEPIPVLLDHAPSEIVGQTSSIEIGESSLRIVGIVTGNVNEDGPAKKVVSHATRGFTWRASPGIEPKRVERVQAGDSVSVNGREFDGPLYVVREGMLDEVSFLSLAADRSTSVQVAAKRAALENTAMQNEQSTGTAAPVAPDVVKRLTATWDGLTDEMRAYPRLATGFGMSLTGEMAERDFDELVSHSAGIVAGRKEAALEAGYGPGGQRFGDSRYDHIDPQPRTSRSAGDPKATLAAALLMHIGQQDVAEKAWKDKPGILQAAADLHVHHSLDLAARALTLAGISAPQSRDEMLRASFSTTSLPAAFGLAGDKVLEQSLTASPASWRSWCARKSVNNFREHTVIRPFFAGGGFERVAPSGEITHGTANESTFTLQANTYGRMITISRTEIVNDDLGAVGEIFAEVGRQSARKVADLVYETLLDNTGDFFGTGNANFYEDAAAPLSIASLTVLVRMLRKQKGEDGQPISLEPRVLLVPPEIEMTARQLMNSTEVQRNTSSTDLLPVGNPHRGTLTLEVEPRLSDTDFHASASTVAWFLLTGPGSAAALNVSFLNGVERPTVEEIALPGHLLGVGLRAFGDFGANQAEYRGGVKSKGSA